MRKFLAVVKHEYRKVVIRWSFLVGTFLIPFLMACFAAVPALIFSIKGEPTRMVIVDPTGKIEPRLKSNLSAEKIEARAKKQAAEAKKDLSEIQQGQLKRGTEELASGFEFVPYVPANGISGSDIEAARHELTEMVMNGELDAFLFIPADINATDAVFEFRTRRGGDFVLNDTLEQALNDAVRSQRLADANISEDQLEKLGGKIDFNEKGIDDAGKETSSEGVWITAFGIGLMIYFTLAIYGQVIMGAVVEEKETRLAEILFSSATPFELMAGKLVGVGLAGLTQLSIWIVSVAILIAAIALQTDLAQIVGNIPAITPMMIVYFLVFFLLGYFIYASMFALIGSMVTTVQEAGQFAFPPVMIMLACFYLSFAVVRDPNSWLSFWASIAPFSAPITMPVRILSDTPPFWQIGLSIVINVIAIAGLMWVASRVYRVGMLMYGKRATIPEVWKWIRQA